MRGLLLDPPVPCAHCQREVATELDHDPPLAMHVHRAGSGCCRLIPSCPGCQRSPGLLVADGTWRPGVQLASVEAEEEEERGGIGQDDPRWRAPWLAEELDRMPASASWPRLMSLPHRRAVDSLGAEFVAWAE